jgi:Uma2 family endonuclease
MECNIEMNRTELLAPELIQEVFSDSNQHDLVRSVRTIGEKQGVGEYWIIEPSC